MSSTWAVEEEVRAIRYPKILLESEPRPAEDLDLPPSTYPLAPLNRAVIHGSRHGFLSTSSGTLSFKAFEIRLPGRMPIEFAPVYSSGISESLPPALPGQGGLEPRRVRDLGLNWILDYASYLTTTPTGVSMWTPEGDTIVWVDQGNNTFRRSPDVASHHLKLQRITSPPPTKYVETRSDGTKWTYKLFTGGFFLTEIKDRSGNTITLTYTNNLLSRVENSDGAWINILRPLYDPQYPPVVFPQERVVQITDSTGRVMHFDYNSAGLLTSVTDVLGEVWTFTYGANNKLATAVDPLGHQYLNVTYDTAHRVASYEAGDGPWTLNYATPHVTKVTDALGNQWQYDYDTNSGVTTRVVEPTTGDYQIVLDVNKNPVAYEGPEGGDAVWTYNAEHQPLSYRPPESTVSVQYSYNTTEGWLNSLTRLDGTTTTFVRDTAGRVTEERETFEFGSNPPYPERAWTASYAANGDRLSLRMPNGNIGGVGQGWLWTFTYDGFGNIDTATDPTGRVFEFDFTPQGDLWKFRRPDNEDPPGTIVKAQWIHTRDLLGRVTAETDPLGNVWTWTYDEAGRLQRKDGPAGTAIRYGYDDRFRVTEIIQEQPGAEPDFTSAIGYDAAGRLTSKTTPGGSTWTYGYDASSRLTSITDPLDRVTGYTRDLAGKIITITHPGGRQVTMTRDAAGRLTQRVYPGGRTENFEYDVAGRLSLAEYQPNAGVEWTYDELGQPATVRNYLDWNVRELTYSYDPNGNRWRRAGGTTELYEYDELDRLISSESYFPWLATYDEVSGRRTSVTLDHEPNQNNYPGINADEESWEYDLAGRVTNHAWVTTTSDDGDVTYAYDAEGRTTHVQSADDRTLETVYNPLGLPERREYTEDDVLTATDLDYDDDGRLVQSLEQEGTDEPIETTFEWDDAGRLSTATRDLTRRTYTWEDAPQDVDSASARVWRAPDDTTEDTIEAQYDYQGRLLSTTAHSAENPPTSLNNQVWLPFESPTMFYRTLRQLDGTDEVMWSVVDAGGATWMDVDQGTGSWARMLSEITAIDRWAESRRFSARSPVVQLDNPFRLGQWEPAAFRASDERLEPPGLVTGLSATRSLIEDILSVERGGDVTIDDAPSPAFSDVVDNWLGDLLMPKGLSGQAQRKDAGEPRGAPPDDSLNAEGGGGGIPKLWDISVMWALHVGGYRDDPNAVQFNLCPPRQGGGPSAQIAPGHGGVMICDWWEILPGGSGGTATCNEHWSRNRPVGDEASFNYPDESPWGVSLVNGEFTNSVTDLTVYDAFGDISFTRTYRSGVDYDGPLGPRWSHNWEESLDSGVSSTEDGQVCGTMMRWVSPDGGYLQFHWNDDQDKWDSPAGSLYELKGIPGGSTFQLRHASGTVKHFDSLGRLVKVVKGGHELVLTYTSNPGSRLLSIYSVYSDGWILRMNFTHNPTSGRLERVTSPQAGSVDYTYTAAPCGELWTVTRDATKLGFDKEGTELNGEHAPKTQYTYHNLDCNLGNSTENHKLENIEVQQHNPLTGVGGWETVLRNQYRQNPPLGAADPEYMRVRYQCLGAGTCGPSDPWDIEYNYTPSWTMIIDRRLAPSIREKHVYAGGELSQIIEDYQGPRERTTQYRIEGGLLKQVTFPDETCQIKQYATVAGIDQVIEERTSFGDGCTGGGPLSTDLVTRYTYEPMIGKVRTVTGPKAFPTGVVPGNFSASMAATAGYKEFTTFYDYDVNQTAPGSLVTDYPTGVRDLCEGWAIPCPEQLGNVNADIDMDGADEDQFFGNVVRVYRWGESDTGLAQLTTLYANQPDGRRWKSRRPDGVVTQYSYYDSGSSGWDLGNTAQHHWQPGSNPGKGPLSKTVVKPQTGSALSDLITEYGWDGKARLNARKDPGGVGIERNFSQSGQMLRERFRCFDSSGCATVPNHTLRETRSSYDLRGRLVRQAVYEGDTGQAQYLKASSWTTYDDLGRPRTFTVDPDPDVAPGSVDQTPDPELHLMSETVYDGRGRAIKTVSPEGRVTCTEYDTLDRAIKVWRRQPVETHPVADAACTAVQTGEPVVTTDYDVMDRVFKVKDPEGTETFRWYDELGRLRYTSDGQPAGTIYPEFGEGTADPPTGPQNPLKWYDETTYDHHAGLPIRTRFFGRDGHGGSGFLRVGWAEYDKLGRPTRTYTSFADPFVAAGVADTPLPLPNPLPSDVVLVSETTYKSDGKVRKQRDAGGRETNFEYDGFGRRNVTTLPQEPEGGRLRDTILIEFDPNSGRPFKTTRTIYHPVSGFHTEAAQQQYDPWGRVWKSVGELSDEDLITTFEYDALSRKTTTARRWTDVTNWDADLDLNPDDRASRITYDRIGRVFTSEQRSAPDTWAKTTYGYDRDGLTTSMTDPRDKQTRWEYGDGSVVDGRGRLHRMIYPLENSKHQTIEMVLYDANGNPKRIEHRDDNSISAHRIVWEQQFDDYNRLTQRESLSSQDVMPSTDPPQFYGTTKQTFEYDDLGRMTRAQDTSPTSEQAIPNITTLFKYDTGGRLLEEDQKLPLTGTGPVSHLVNSTYDADGFRRELKYPVASGKRYTLSLDPDWMGRLKEARGPSNPAVADSTAEALLRYTYAGGNVWSRWHGNDVETQYFEGSNSALFDRLGRVEGMRTVDLQHPTLDPIADFRYDYDRVGNRTHEMRRHEPLTSPVSGQFRTRAYKTDLMGRLEQWREGPLLGTADLSDATNPPSLLSSQSDGENWALDLVGNWGQHVELNGANPDTTEAFLPNPLNQYTQMVPDGEQEAQPLHAFDWLGQLRQDDSKGQKYVWDRFGRLTKVLTANNSLIATYRYDALNRRVQKVVESSYPAVDATTLFIYDGWRAIEERTVQGAPLQESVRARYGFGLGLDEVVWMDRDLSPSPDGAPEKRFFLHQDGLGSVTAVTDDTRNAQNGINVVERMTYSAYGKASVWTGLWDAGTGAYGGTPYGVSNVHLPYLYTGQRLDAETGLYYYKNRFFDAQVGRFLKRDLVGYEEGPNLYAYVRSSPHVAVDPAGLQSRENSTQMAVNWTIQAESNRREAFRARVVQRSTEVRYAVGSSQTEAEADVPDFSSDEDPDGCRPGCDYVRGKTTGRVTPDGSVWNDMLLGRHWGDPDLVKFTRGEAMAAFMCGASVYCMAVMVGVDAAQDPNGFGPRHVAAAALLAIRFPTTREGVIIGEHALKRMNEYKVSMTMVNKVLEKGKQFWDPKNKTVQHVLEEAFASGDDLLVATNPVTNKVTTVIKGENLVRPRFEPIPPVPASASPPIPLGSGQ